MGNSIVQSIINALDADKSYGEASQGEIDLICNGCGSAQAKFDFIPDTVYGLSVKPACYIHDWDYSIGETIKYKKMADRRFRNNMLRLIDSGSCRLLKGLRRRRALKYYYAVKAFGGPAYWAGKN